MSLGGQREVINADWQDLQESCPIWNTRSSPGCRKFDEPSNGVDMELSIRKILYVSGPFIFFHIAGESELGIWGMLSLHGPSTVTCGLGRLELGRNLSWPEGSHKVCESTGSSLRVVSEGAALQGNSVRYFLS